SDAGAVQLSETWVLAGVAVSRVGAPGGLGLGPAPPSRNAPLTTAWLPGSPSTVTFTVPPGPTETGKWSQAPWSNGAVVRLTCWGPRPSLTVTTSSRSFHSNPYRGT